MNTVNRLFYAQGNLGAISFMSQVSDDLIIGKIDKCETLRGTNLWVLYSDLCDKDMKKVRLLCENCPDDILEDACGRQDYSGKELVSEYLREDCIKIDLTKEEPEFLGEDTVTEKLTFTDRDELLRFLYSDKFVVWVASDEDTPCYYHLDYDFLRTHYPHDEGFLISKADAKNSYEDKGEVAIYRTNLVEAYDGDGELELILSSPNVG